jgi:hypothetical protein
MFMNKPGFVSAIPGDQTLEIVLKMGQQLGYDCVEIMCRPVGKAERRDAGVTHLNVDSLDANRIKETQTQLRDVGVCISGLGFAAPSPSPCKPLTTEFTVQINIDLSGGDS